MAKRFGGKYSPQGPHGASLAGSKQPPVLQSAKPAKAGARVNLLFVAPLPLAVKAFLSEPVVMATYLAGFGVLILAAWLTAEGVKAHQAYDARKVARRPAIPRKLFGAALTGGGLGLAGLAGHGPMDAVIFGVLGLILHVMAFGADPLRSKGMDGVDDLQNTRVARAVEEAERHLADMAAAIRALNDRRLIEQVDHFQATARHMFRVIEDDPRDLIAARKYLSVYLTAARDASTKFAGIYARNQSAEARAQYEALLDDLEQQFASRTQKLLAEDHIDLNIEIDVLRERLAREGVRVPRDEDRI